MIEVCIITAEEAATATGLHAREVFRPAAESDCGLDVYPVDSKLRFQLGELRPVRVQLPASENREAVDETVDVFTLVAWGRTWDHAVKMWRRKVGDRSSEMGDRSKALPFVAAAALVALFLFIFPASSEAAMETLPSLAQLGGDQMTLGSVAPAAVVSGAITISETQAGMGALALVSLLIGYHFTFGKYIRQQAGVKEPATETRIADQPITVTASVEFVPMPRFKELEMYIHAKEHDHKNEMQALTQGVELRRIETAEQFSDLRDKLDQRFDEAVKANNSSASKIHSRIDTLAEKQGQIIGEMKHIGEAATRAAAAAQQAAIAAAQSNGGRKS